MAVGFLKFVCVWNLSYSARHGTLPEGRGHEQPPLWIRGAGKPWWSVVVTGNVHKAAALFDAHLWFLGQAEASGKSASGLWNIVECAWAKPQGLVSHYFFLLKHHIHTLLDSITFFTVDLLDSFFLLFVHSETIHILLSVANVHFHRQLRGLFSLHIVSRIYSLLNFDNGHCVWWDLISRFRFDWHSCSR